MALATKADSPEPWPINPFNTETAQSDYESLHQLIQLWADRTPDKIAIAAPGYSPMVYMALLTQVEYVGKTLNACGVGRNDRVVIVLPNGPQMAAVFLGVAAAATAAPLNPAYRENELEFYLSDLNASAVIVQSDSNSPVISVSKRKGIPVLQLSPVSGFQAGRFTLISDDRPRSKPDGFALSDDEALALHTSGTTSKPKLVSLTQANLCASTRNMRDSLSLTSSDCCLDVMPLFHIHGLMVLLSSLAAGGSVVCVSGSDLQNFYIFLEEFKPSWYTAAPAIHQMILGQANVNREIIKRCPMRFIRSSSSALPPQVIVEMERVFNAPVIESYGMTEAALQITSNPLPPRQRKLGSVGVAAGPEVAIMDAAGDLLPIEEVGEVVVRGANVMNGYAHPPGANATDFTQGWFRTGDQGYLDGDGYLFLTGRIKEQINRGGEKISPREVDEAIMDHPAVAQVATFAVPHPVLGEDVAAAIVLRKHALATSSQIRDFAAARLAYFKVPQQILILDEIPKGPTGKVQRLSLAKTLGLTESRQALVRKNTDYLAPRTSTEAGLTLILSQVLKINQVGVRDNFFDLGGFSLRAVELVTRIEKTFGKTLPFNIVFQAPTVEQLANLLSQEVPSTRWSNLVALQPNGSNPPFFWIHGQISDAFLPRCLGADQPVYGLAYQSLDGNPALHTSIEDIAAHYRKEIQIVQPQGPYFIGGYCVGGLVALEVAQQLKKQAQDVALLFVLEPTFLRNFNPPSPFSPISRGLARETEPFDHRASRHLHLLATLNSRQMLTYILVRVTGMIKVMANKSAQSAEKISKQAACKIYAGIRGYPLPPSLRTPYILGIYNRAARRYTPRPYAGPVAIFLPKNPFRDALSNWQRLVTDTLEIHEVPGDHHDVLHERNVRVWAEQLKVLLQKAQTRVA